MIYPKDEPRVKIWREWIDLFSYLKKESPERWLRFFQSVTGYAVGEEDKPDFSDDKELQSLWERTNCRPFDKTTLKPGWLKIWKRKGGRNE